ncbi:MAG: hypothetical protein AAFX93_11150 [Verrucomicrobiota bacterium]
MNELKELQRQADALQTRMPPQAERARVRQEQVKLNSQVQKLKKNNGSGSGTPALVPTSDATMRADALFEALLEQHRVILMSEAIAETNDTRAFRRITDNSPGTTLWKIELAGNYANVAHLLAALGETHLPITPVALEMDASLQTKSDLRRWYLWSYR